MKLPLLTLTSLLFTTTIANANELSATFFKDSYQRGSYIESYGEVNLREAREINGNLFHLLSPIGDNQLSSVVVNDGYCVILADKDHFGGEWKVLSSGTHDTLGNFDNKTTSLLVYKNIDRSGKPCNPLEDIPLLYDRTNFLGDKYPLIVGTGYMSQSPGDSTFSRLPGYIFGLTDQNFIVNDDLFFGEYGLLTSSQTVNLAHLFIDPDFLTPDLHVAGGFSRKAESISVPECYSSALRGLYLSTTSTTGIGAFTSHRFPLHLFHAGNYSDLSEFGGSVHLANRTLDYRTKRIDNCEQDKGLIIDSINYEGLSCSGATRRGVLDFYSGPGITYTVQNKVGSNWQTIYTGTNSHVMYNQTGGNYDIRIKASSNGVTGDWKYKTANVQSCLYSGTPRLRYR